MTNPYDLQTAAQWAQASQLAEVLQANLSPHDQALRQHAEQQVQLAKKGLPQFSVLLSEILISPQYPPDVRQLAGVILKQLDFSEFNASPESRAATKQILLRGYIQNASKLQTAVGMGIAAIAKYDYPDEWPELLPTLVSSVKAPKHGQDEVSGAIACLQLISEDIQDDQLVQVLQELLPPLLQLLVQQHKHQQVHNVEGGEESVAVLTLVCNLLRGIQSLSGDHLAKARALLKPGLADLMQLFSHVLSATPASQAAKGWEAPITALKCLQQLLVTFGKMAEPHAPGIVQAAWHVFTRYLPVYKASESERNVEEGARVEAHVQQMFEFWQTVLGMSRLLPLLTQYVSELIYIVIAYMTLTNAQLDLAENDLAAYMQEEERLDEWIEPPTVRVGGEMLLEELCDTNSDMYLPQLLGAVQRHLNESAAAHKAGDPQWWRAREAALLALGSIRKVVGSRQREGMNLSAGGANFSVAAVMDNLLQEDLLGVGVQCPWLMGRALWLGGRYSDLMDNHHREGFYAAAVSGISQACPAPVRLSSLNVIGHLSTQLPADFQRPHLGAILQALLQFGHGMEEDVLPLWLEVLETIVPVDPSVSMQFEEQLSEQLMACWRAQRNDPYGALTVQTVLQHVAQLPQCPGLTGKAVPALVQEMRASWGEGSASKQGLVEAGLDLLASLVRYFPSDYLQQLYTALHPDLHTVFHTRLGHLPFELYHHATLLTIQMVTLAGHSFLPWIAPSAEQGIEELVQIVRNLLLGSMTEEGIYTGVLAAALARQYPQLLSPSHLRGLIHPLLQKLLAFDSYHLTLGTSALLGLLFIAQPTQTVALLQATELAAVSENSLTYTELGVPLNALTVGLTFVTERYVELRHPHYQRVALHGLLALLVHGGAELDDVKLPVQVASVAAAPGVRTRAQTARVPLTERYRLVPVGVRVLQVLMDQVLAEQEAAEGGGAGAGVWGEEDDDDEDGEGDFDPDIDDEAPDRSLSVEGRAMGLAGIKDEDEDDGMHVGEELYSNLYHLTAPLDGLSVVAVAPLDAITQALRQLYTTRRPLLENASHDMTPQQMAAMEKLLTEGPPPGA